MKVLFGINNDDTVKGIVNFYNEKYNVKLEYKNVYYWTIYKTKKRYQKWQIQ